MNTAQTFAPTNRVFAHTVKHALARLKQKLQRDYEQAYPALGQIIHLVLDEEESRAWKLSAFPHLLLPDLVEAHVERLNLQPAVTTHEDIFVPERFGRFDYFQPAPAWSC